MNYKINTTTKGLFTLGLVCSSAQMALAQVATPAAQESATLEEIVVTATRRATNVQDVPIAITAISGDTLRDRGITDPRQLSGLAPNLAVDQGLGDGQTHVSIRGQTSTSFALEASSPAAIYIDDVYQAYQFGLGTQLFDMGRIEVLRGPQGTLFGKNTTAGSVNFYAQTPTQRDEGYVTLEGGAGDYNLYAIEGAVNKVLTGNLAMRASFRGERREAYVDNLADGHKLGEFTNYNGRLQFAWTSGADTTVNLKLFGLKHTGDAPVYIARGYFVDPCTDTAPYFRCDLAGNPTPLTSDSRTTYSDINPQYENYENYGATLKIDQGVGGSTLTSITNIQYGHYNVATNDDGMLGDFFHSRQHSKTKQMSQELRLATSATAPLKAIIGVYGQYDRIQSNQGSMSSRLDPAFAAFEYTQLNIGDSKTTTFATFTSLTYDLSSAFSITGGVRYSLERKQSDNTTLYNNFRDVTDQYFDFDYALSQYDPINDVLQVFNGSRNYKRLTWDFTANFKPSDDVLLYAKVGTGFRSGGFFPAPAGEANFTVALDPETVLSYEAGFKSEWLNHKLRINSAAYLVDYKDMQVQIANSTGAGIGFSNAGAARIKGLELEVEVAPLTGLTLSGSVGFNEAKFTDYITPRNGVLVNLSGNPLPYASRWTSNLALSYETPVSATNSIRFNTSWNYHDRFYFDSTKDNITSEPERFIGNARLGFGTTENGWEIAAFVNNILNEDVRGFTFTLGSIAPTIYAPRRTYGLQGTYRF